MDKVSLVEYGWWKDKVVKRDVLNEKVELTLLSKHDIALCENF